MLLYRHSDRFYSTLIVSVTRNGVENTGSRPRSFNILDLVVTLCADSDATVRKFACFAGNFIFVTNVCTSITSLIIVGNAAFHSTALYPYLPFSISFLVDTLTDPDDKTRANGAGALGNLARNGGELCHALCSSKCPELLIDMALNDSSIFAKVRFIVVSLMLS